MHSVMCVMHLHSNAQALGNGCPSEPVPKPPVDGQGDVQLGTGCSPSTSTWCSCARAVKGFTLDDKQILECYGHQQLPVSFAQPSLQTSIIPITHTRAAKVPLISLRNRGKRVKWVRNMKYFKHWNKVFTHLSFNVPFFYISGRLL